MKPSLAPFLAATVLFVANSTCFAELPDEVESAIALLRDAKESKTPAPLLEDAKKRIQGWEAWRGNPGLSKVKGGANGGHLANGGAAREKKQHALETIEKAIETAKTSGDVKPKCDAAIAAVRSAGDLRR